MRIVAHRCVVPALLAIALAGCGSSSGLQLKDCTIGDRPARCGQLAVPENPTAPGGKKIALNVAVVPAISGHAKPDPLLWFSGWGGAGVSDDAANVLSALRSVNFDRDLVFIDQRGTGSSKLECPEVAGLVPPFDAAAVTASARHCAARLGPNLRYYTSAVAVDDFDRVRQELGYDKVNLYGGSYGVTTGQVYLQRHGAHVRTATFDSGSLLDVRIFERVAVNAQKALDKLFALCAGDTNCSAAYPNLRREFAAIQARLAKAPLRVAGTAGQLDPATFAFAVEELLAYNNSKALIPLVIHLVATGQAARAAAVIPDVLGGGPPELAYQLLIQCNEHWAQRRLTETIRQAHGTFFAPAAAQQAQLLDAACEGFPKADVPAAIGQRVRSTVPTLFLTGTADPADPPANIANVRRELPSSRVVLFPDAGHGQLGTVCAQKLIADFVTAGSASGLDAACARTAVVQYFQIQPPPGT